MRVGPGVSEDVLAVLVADDHALGERVERTPEPDGVGRRLLHRLCRIVDPDLDLTERPLDAPSASFRGTALDPEPGSEGGEPLLE